jgi:hypothetical protein
VIRGYSNLQLFCLASFVFYRHKLPAPDTIPDKLLLW